MRDKASKQKTKPRRSSQVPEQYWGYSLQAVRFLHLLIGSPPGTAVSLEVFEDVGVHDQAGNAIASQVKSGLIKNPISNRATDLWKTFSNWSNAVNDGLLDVDKTTFEIYLGRPGHSGEIAESFSKASNINSANEAVLFARERLWGQAPNYNLRGTGSAEVDDLINNFLDEANLNNVGIVERFRITHAAKDPITDLRTAVAQKWIPNEIVDDVIKHAHGWIEQRIAACIQQRQPAIIISDDFHSEIKRFIPRLDFHRILVNVAGAPSSDQVAAERVRTYVRQVEIIESTDEDTIAAINDYLRASVMRSKWGEQGIVHEQSFDEFSEALMLFWRHRKRSNSIAHQNLNPVQQGQLLLADCAVHSQTLQGLEVPAEFVPGSYHALADDLKLGWHPQYDVHLKDRKSHK